MEQINNQRLYFLQSPGTWDIPSMVNSLKGEPDIVHYKSDNVNTLYSIKSTKLLAMVEVKPEQLMTTLIEGTEVHNDEVHISDNRTELYDAYNTEVDMCTTDGTKLGNIKRIIHQAFGYMVINDLRYGLITSYVRTWFLCRDPNDPSTLRISPTIPINQQHTDHQASFLECMHYFEDISRENPELCPLIPPTIEYDHSWYNSDDPKGQDNQDNSNISDQSDHDECKFSSRVIRRSESEETKGNEIMSDDELLKDMKNYDRDQLYFGKILGSGQSGRVFTAKLCGKIGALKMVDLCKNENRLKEMLNETKIYLGPLMEIQGIYVPKLLNFGVLHETLVFIHTSLAGKTFAKLENNVTGKEKQLAIEGLLAIHARGVMHGDIRLENIMVQRKELMGYSCVWWIDFAWSKMECNANDLKRELITLKCMLGLRRLRKKKRTKKLE